MCINSYYKSYSDKINLCKLELLSADHNDVKKLMGISFNLSLARKNILKDSIVLSNLALTELKKQRKQCVLIYDAIGRVYDNITILADESEKIEYMIINNNK